MNRNNSADLVKNAQFSSYSDWYGRLQHYQEQHDVTMSRSSSRHIKEDGINEELIYTEISYKCKRAGVYKPKGKGIRNAKSTKTNCPAFIELRVPKKKQYLQITDICLAHNHTGDLIQEESMPKSGVMESGEQESGDSENKCAAVDSTMPYQVTDEDLLEITYSAEVLNECELETEKDAEKDLTKSLKRLSVEEISPGDSQRETTKHDWKSGHPMSNPTVLNQPVRFSDSTENKSEHAALEISGSASTVNASDAIAMPNIKSEHTTLKITCSGSASTVIDLDAITMPEVNPKGRPRGRALMAVGLPIQKKQPKSFSALRPVVQAKMILQWVISDEGTVNNILTGEYLIREADIPSDDQIIDSIMADEVDLGVLSQYAEKRALQKLAKVVQKKKDKNDWRCRTCRNSLSEWSIFCDACLSWYDYSCVNLKRAPKAKQWFCPGCKL